MSERAARYAICIWKFIPETTVRAAYPEKMSVDTRSALDELTFAGLLERDDDPRGPMEWRPTQAMRQFTGERTVPTDLL